MLLMLAPMLVMSMDLLMNWQGVWVTGTHYKIAHIYNTNQNSAPVVTNSGHTYVLIQNVAESQVATVPGSNSTSWAQVA